MNSRIWRVIVIVIGALCLSACGEHESMADNDMPSHASRDMPDNPMRGASGEHMALGIVNSIDLAAGTMNISHEPVESVGWPAMTMLFRLADPSVARGIEPGQRVEFRFATDDGGTIMAIAAADWSNVSVQ